jgi:O-acetylhomoserine (thiol)-lyase
MSSLGTRQVRAGISASAPQNPVTVPIYQSAAYEFTSWEQARDIFALRRKGNIYSRTGNPTQIMLEQRLAALDDGVAALATGSGQSAVAVALLSLVRAGDHIVASSALYGGTMDLLVDTFKDFNIDCTLVDPHDPDAWHDAVKQNTRVFFAESIGNPTASILDVRALADVAENAGVPLIVDNTIATPALLRPKEHGADIVVYSATKHLGGHGTSLAGAIVDLGTFDFGADPGRWPQFTQPYQRVGDLVLWDTFGRENSAYLVYARTKLVHDLGPTLSPFNAQQILLGVETLDLRLAKMSETTTEIVQFLEGHSDVARTYHPLAEGDPSTSTARASLGTKTPSILALDLVGGEFAVPAFIDALKCFTLAANIGDARSLVIHPATTTHSHFSDQQLLDAGFSKATVRLSVGLEDSTDLISDLHQALAATQS